MEFYIVLDKIYVEKRGRWYKLIALFAGDNSVEEANVYMSTHPVASVLTYTGITDLQRRGIVVLVSKHDKGVTRNPNVGGV